MFMSVSNLIRDVSPRYVTIFISILYVQIVYPRTIIRTAKPSTWICLVFHYACMSNIVRLAQKFTYLLRRLSFQEPSG